MKTRHWFLVAAGLLLAGWFVGCAAEDDDSDDGADDDTDELACEDRDVCERHVECNIVESVDDCLDNMDDCADRDGFVSCMCDCQARYADCAIEHCIPVCADLCGGAA
jgi:hypothetical protein